MTLQTREIKKFPLFSEHTSYYEIRVQQNFNVLFSTRARCIDCTKPLWLRFSPVSAACGVVRFPFFVSLVCCVGRTRIDPGAVLPLSLVKLVREPAEI